MPPRRKKDRIDGNDTTMMATAISAMENTSAAGSVWTHLDTSNRSIKRTYKRWSTHG
jgi:hypothetical protein